MGKRGHKPQFMELLVQIRIANFTFFGQGNAVGNGTSTSRGEKNQKIHLPPLRQRFL